MFDPYVHMYVLFFLFSAMGIEVERADWRQVNLNNRDFCGLMVQYPDTEGTVEDFTHLVEDAHANGVSCHCTDISVEMKIPLHVYHNDPKFLDR